MLSVYDSNVAWIFVLLCVHLCIGRHIIIYTNVIFIIIFILFKFLVTLRPPSSLCPWLSCAFNRDAVSSFRQLFTQSARKLELNMAIRWHTESRNRHNQSNTDAISNFIVPSLSFSHTFSSSPFISPLICSPPYDHNPSPSIGVWGKERWRKEESG